MNNFNEHKNYISFPTNEISLYKKILKKQKFISTHRILQEYNKYKLGKIYYNKDLGLLRVVSVTKLFDITYSLGYNHFKKWTKEQQHDLLNSNKIEYIVLEKYTPKKKN